MKIVRTDQMSGGRWTVGRIVGAVLVLGVGLSSTFLYADVQIDLLTIGDVGNPYDVPYDTHPEYHYGTVDYVYQIGKYEVTVGQYTEFLNTKAQSDPYGLYNINMGGNYTIGGSLIERSGTSGSYQYTAVEGKETQPVRGLGFWDCLRFCNWMHNGQGGGDTETGSYNLASDNVYLTREADATWVLPNENEWYKAAYYDAELQYYYKYPNSSDVAPPYPSDETTPREMIIGDDPWWQGGGHAFAGIGETTGESPYGAYNMGGNVEEWTEYRPPEGDYYRMTFGGNYISSYSSTAKGSYDPSNPFVETGGSGFRIALVPEPSTVGIFILGVMVLTRQRKGRRGIPCRNTKIP